MSTHQPSRLRFRASRAQARFIALPFAAIALIEFIEHVADHGRVVNPAMNWTYLPLIAAFVAAMCLQAWFGATLTADGVIVHGFRRRLIAWRDVTVIRSEEFTSNRVIAIYERGHRRTRLRYPTSGPLYADRQFDAKLAVIQDWWARQS
ncbi:MAG TPA: hypothetical protein VGI58_05915 [Streptosporangiaceae bacterium]